MLDMRDLRPFFEPAGVALIGATEKFGFGYGQTKTLTDQDLGDRLFLVNPSRDRTFGRKTYARLEQVPGGVDLAVLIVPAPAVLDVLNACVEKGVKAAIVQTAGFAEIGDQGRQLQGEMTALARRTGLRIIGPNCVGLSNTENGFSTTETTAEAMKSGAIGVIAQSGVFGNILTDWGPEEGVRFSKVVTLGNRCDVDESELIRYLGRDDQTRVIALYLESVQDGARFRAAVREVAPRKPIIILKSGRSGAGRAATASHTGSLSGEDPIYTGAFNQSGVIRARDIQELFDLAKSFACQPLPRGRRLAVATTSGSLGALTTDACIDLGLSLPELSPDTVRAMRQDAPAWMNVRNPLDVGPSGLLFNAIKALMHDPNVDGIIGIFVIPWLVIEEIEAHGLGVDQFLGWASELANIEGDKPLLISVVGRRELRTLVAKQLGDKTPLISTPENAARVMAGMAKYRAFLSSRAH